MLSSFKFQQFANLSVNQGFKKALQTVKDYPAMLLLPAFSVWTYGSIEKGSCHNCQSSQKIGLSFANTFLNASYTLFLEILVLIIYIPTMGYENLKAWGINVATLSLFLMIPMIVISIIFMSVVSCMDMCSFCSCSCCCDYLLPMTERTSNMFGLQEESTTEIVLVKTNPPESPIKETTLL